MFVAISTGAGKVPRARSRCTVRRDTFRMEAISANVRNSCALGSAGCTPRVNRCLSRVLVATLVHLLRVRHGCRSMSFDVLIGHSATAAEYAGLAENCRPDNCG